jgi:hypothetical protein
MRPSLGERGAHIAPRGDVHERDLLGYLSRPQSAASTFWAQIDDVVGGLDHIEIVFDHEQCIAGLEHSLNAAVQLANVVEGRPVVGSSRICRRRSRHATTSARRF